MDEEDDVFLLGGGCGGWGSGGCGGWGGCWSPCSQNFLPFSMW